ncbi:hypothetical protein ACFLXE_00025 [Chloroflexota bacterium]
MTVQARDLQLPWTFAQPDATAVKVKTIPARWQVNEERCGIKLAYEPREHAEGQTLCLMGELHEVGGVTYLVRYDGEFCEELTEGYWYKEQGWYMPEMSDNEVEAFRARLRRDKMLEDNPEIQEMMKLVQRVKRGVKCALVELHSVITEQPDKVDRFRDAVNEYDLGTDYLVFTLPRKIKRMVKERCMTSSMGMGRTRMRPGYGGV